MAVRLAALPPSGKLAVGEKVRALRAAGRTVFNLSGGAPDPGPPLGLNLIGPSPALLEGAPALLRGRSP